MDLTSMPSTSRILYDVPCAVCRDHSSGKHYGVYACDGCAGFFKRSVRRQRSYTCKARTPGRCLVDKTHRNQCRSCRMDKCLDAGMNRDAVQHERGPRNSTIRRQMALYMNDHTTSEAAVPEIAMPKRPLLPPPPPLNIFYPFLYPGFNISNSPVVPFSRTPPLTADLPIDRYSREICEAAAKLLFMNIKWAKGNPAFESLPVDDRVYLLGETWKDMFVIGAAQFLYPFDLMTLVNGNNISMDLRDVELFQVAVAEIAKLRPHNMEYTCLRGIMLFRTSSNRGEESDKLQDLLRVVAEQERNKKVLNEYTAVSHPQESFRASLILELLPIVRRISSTTIEDLFFRATIGDASIETIICDMYKTA